MCFVQDGVLCSRVDVVCAVSFGFAGGVVRSAERLCQGELCYLGHRRKVSALCLLCEIYHRVDHPMNEHLHHLSQLVILKFQLLLMSQL